MKLMSFWSKFFIALAITILATTGAVVGVFAGQKEQIDMGGSIKYTVPYFTVTFLNYDDTVFETQQVAYGHDAVAPANNPTRPGYTFKSWTDYTNITSNRSVTANWIKNEAYLTTGAKWQAIVNASAVGSNANIEQIEFVSSVPSGATLIGSVGVTNETATTVWTEGCGVFDVKAYYTALASGKYKISFYSPYTIYAPKDSSYLFSSSTSANRLTNLTSISFGNFNTSKVTNMGAIFYNCSSLTSLDVSNFDTSNVTDMSSMFSVCSSLTSLNLSNFNTSNVTNMKEMFRNCSSLTSLNLSNFNTSNVTNMKEMFRNCSSLTSLNVSSFNTSKVTDMSYMFNGCSKLTSLNLSNFNTSNVTSMSCMFYYCQVLTSLDLSSFVTSKVTNMYNMFYGCYSLTSLNLSSFDMSKVTNTTDMLAGRSSLTEIKTPKAIGSAAVDLPTKTNYSWFDQANTNNTYTQITSACLSKTLVFHENYSYLQQNWQTALINNNANFKQENIKTIQFVKSVPSGSGYTQVPVGATTSAGTTAFVAGTAGVSDIIAYVKANSSDSSKYDVIFYSPVTIYAPVNSSYLFSNLSTSSCLKNLTSISFGNFNTSKVTNMRNMFNGCLKLTSLNLSNFDTSNVTSMNGMFFDCLKLTSLNLSNFNTSNVTDMISMFFDCSSLTSLNLSNFNTSKVTSMNAMFLACSSLTSLNLSSFDMSKVTNASTMLVGCSGLTEIKTPKAIGSTAVDLPTKTGYSWLDQANTNNAYTQITSACLSKTLVLHKNNSYLRRDWQAALINNNANFKQTNIKTIQFVKSVPSGSGYTQVPVGAKTSAGTTAFVSGTAGVSDIIAYVKANSSDSTKYDVIFYSPVTIYAPIDSSYLFSNSTTANRLTNLTSISFDNFNTSNVINMQRMFWGCSSLASLNLSNFNTSKVTNMYDMFSGCSSLTSLNVSSFNTSNVTSMSYTFWGCSSLTSLNLSNFNTSKVTNMNGMFDGCSSLTSLNVSSFNTSNVTDMAVMFRDCSKLTSLNVSNFDTSNVTYMNGMFHICHSLTSLNFSNFNTSNVTTMEYMFANCSSLTSLNLSSFDTSKVTDMSDMFEWCEKLTSLNLSSFDMSKVTDTGYMLTGCSSLTEIKTPRAIGSAAVDLPTKTGYSWLDQANTNNAYTQITSACLSKTLVLRENNSYLRRNWQTPLINNNANFKQENIKTIQFVNTAPSGSGYTQVSVGATTSAGTTAFAAGTAGVSDVIAYVKANSSDSTKYDVIFYSPVTIYAPVDSSYLFSNSSDTKRLTNLTSISFGNFNTSNVTNMGNMFNYCSSLTSLNLSNFNTSNVTSMYSMFSDCFALSSLDVSSFDTINVTNMGYMFYNCSKLTLLNLSNFHTSNVTNMSVMFRWCHRLTSLNVSSFDTSKVTDMHSMFEGCSQLTSLNLSNFNTSNVTSMSYMFQDCLKLTSLNVSTFNTSNVTRMDDMFYNCSKLISLDLSSFNTSNVTTMYSMFYQCSSLSSLNLLNFNTSKVTNMYSMFYQCSSLSSLNLSNFNTSKVTNMGYMFSFCSSLTSLNLSSFNTSNVTNMGYMFNYCSSLTSLNLSSFDMSKVTNTTYMFRACSALTTIYTPKTMGSTTVSLPGTSDGLHAWYKSTDSNRYTPYTTISSSNTNSTLNLRVAMRTITITWGSDSNGNGNWAFDVQWNGSVQVSSSQGGTQSGTRTFRVEPTTSIQCSFWIQSPPGLIWHKTGSVSISGTCTNSNFGSNTAPTAKGEAHRTANASNFKSDITISFYFSASK